MSLFDKIAALVSIPIGLVFIALGAAGLFVGSAAHFDLPPILGGLPLFLGWSMCVTVIKYWRKVGINFSDEDPPSALFQQFIAEHPEFYNAPRKLQWSGFHRWLDRRPQRDPVGWSAS